MKFYEIYNNGNPVLSERLKKLRKENGYTQEQLAELVDCSSKYISDMEKENPTRRISENMAFRFAQVFGINKDWLLDENTEFKTASEKIIAENKAEMKKFQSAINTANQEAYYMNKAIVCLAALNGYTVEIKDIASETAKTIAAGSGTIADCFKDFMVFYRNGKKEFSLSLEDANHFGNHINDVFLSHIKWNIKTE